MNQTANPSIQLTGVSVTYANSNNGSTEALESVDLALRPHEFVSVVGPSGCGKSTLLKLAAGLLEPTSGQVQLFGKRPQELTAARELGVVFQDPTLMGWRTALGNVELAFELAHRRQGARNEARRLLQLVGLAGFEGAFPTELSGGMKSRVAIARALALSPSVLLMDECFGALDELTRQKLNTELLRIWSEERPSVLFVTHNVGEAVFLSDRVVVLSSRPGRVVDDVLVDLPRPRNEDTLDLDQFFQLTKHVRHTLSAASGGEVAA